MHSRSCFRGMFSVATERLGVSELIGAEYVATTPFEARLLRHRSPDANAGIGSASVWAEIPTLTDLHSRDLAKLLDNDEAVEDFRERIRLAMATSSEFLGQIQAVQSAAAGIESARIWNEIRDKPSLFRDSPCPSRRPRSGHRVDCRAARFGRSTASWSRRAHSLLWDSKNPDA